MDEWIKCENGEEDDTRVCISPPIKIHRAAIIEIEEYNYKEHEGERKKNDGK